MNWWRCRDSWVASVILPSTLCAHGQRWGNRSTSVPIPSHSGKENHSRAADDVRLSAEVSIPDHLTAAGSRRTSPLPQETQNSFQVLAMQQVLLRSERSWRKLPAKRAYLKKSPFHTLRQVCLQGRLLVHPHSSISFLKDVLASWKWRDSLFLIIATSTMALHIKPCVKSHLLSKR